MIDLATLLWPPPRLGEALIELAREAGLSPGAAPLGSPPAAVPVTEGARLARWVEQAASYLGVEAEVIEPTYSDIERWLRAAPLLILLEHTAGLSGWLALIRGGRSCQVLGADGLTHRIATKDVLELLRAPLEAPIRSELKAMIETLPLSGRRRARALSGLARERLHHRRLPVAFLLAPRRAQSFWTDLRLQGVARDLVLGSALHAAGFAVGLGSLWILGRMALLGQIDRGWLVAWALLLSTQILLAGVEASVQGRLSLRAGLVLRDRLLYGILKLSSEEVRGEGVGALLGRVLESQIAESQALSAALAGAFAVIELALCGLLLASATISRLSAAALGAWLVLAAFIAVRARSERRKYARARLALTHELVEGIAGYRTRLVHESGESWHAREDHLLAGYGETSRRADRYTTLLAGLVPRGWFVLGLLSLAPAMVHERATGTALALALAALLLSYRALRRVAPGLEGAVECSIAWEQLSPILTAATRGERPGAPLSAALLAGDSASRGASLVEAHELAFRHRPDRAPVFAGLNLRIEPADRWLLTGDSGGGKSTLSAVLAGLRRPDSGVLLYRGLDRATLGDSEWRRRIALAPQFHENHVFANSFGFNLLMARRWPPTPEDIEEALAVCRELGLDGLIERMPGGLAQTVGETGWQLSHGERSRLFIARALLQDPDLLILDESFAALDPETFRRCLKTVTTRARALVAVAHP